MYSENSTAPNGGKVDNEKYFDDGQFLRKHHTFVYEQLQVAAKRFNRDLSWLDPTADIGDIVAAAKANGLEVAGAYPRCSTGMQDSYYGQIERCIHRAMENGAIVLPAYIFGDQGVSGKKKKRPGLDRFKTMLERKQVTTVVTFHISRIFRKKYLAIQFLHEEIHERGIRALDIVDNFDTNNPHWKRLVELTMLASDILMEGLPDFVRMGQRAQFLAGFVIGACPKGFRPVPDLTAGYTKKGNPLCRPEVVPEIKAIIVDIFEFIVATKNLDKARDKYNEAIRKLPPEIREFAIHPNASSGEMRPGPFRRMLEDEKLITIWTYGKRRNNFIQREDKLVQDKVPENDWAIQYREHLRIVSDELFYRVQQILAPKKRGKRGTRKGKKAPLSSSLPSLCRCAGCGNALHYENMTGMTCPVARREDRDENGELKCTIKGTVGREEALGAILIKLQSEVLSAPDLVDEIAVRSTEVDIFRMLDTLRNYVCVVTDERGETEEIEDGEAFTVSDVYEALVKLMAEHTPHEREDFRREECSTTP